jgi:hypothetical protein
VGSSWYVYVPDTKKSHLTTADGESSMAALTINMPGEAENILSMEKFDGMLTKVQCTNTSIEMTFQDDATFAYAQGVWDWVNGADNHSFVMVAGPGDCGNNTNRIPYVVHHLDYDEVENTASLTAERKKWEQIAHTFEFVAGSVARPVGEVVKRDTTKTASIDFNHDLEGSFAISSGDFSARMTCTNCTTFGQFDMEFKVKQTLFVPTGASMKLSPKGVGAVADVSFSGSGTLVDGLTKSFDIISIPVSGLSIPGLLEIGPFLTVKIGAEILPISLTGTISTGATAKLSDDAVLEIDLLSPENNEFSGWEPEVETKDVTLSASVTGGVGAFLSPAVELKAEALGKSQSLS